MGGLVRRRPRVPRLLWLRSHAPELGAAPARTHLGAFKRPLSPLPYTSSQTRLPKEGEP